MSGWRRGDGHFYNELIAKKIFFACEKAQNQTTSAIVKQ